jgi:hypothetical protein
MRRGKDSHYKVLRYGSATSGFTRRIVRTVKRKTFCSTRFRVKFTWKENLMRSSEPGY